MEINQAGIDLIKRFEGLQLMSYRCPAGVWTIGYGHTGPAAQARGIQITEAKAEELLRGDLSVFESGVSRLLGGAATNENEFSAMVCLAFNVGLGSFKTSSVLRFHRDGKRGEAANAFLLWNKASGKALRGLTTRRDAERHLYLTRVR
jgi:lysozyme